MWTRLEADRIVEVTALDPAGRYPSELIWTPVPASLSPWIEPGWRIEGERLTPRSLDHLLSQMAKRLAARRFQEQTKGVVVAGHRFHSDAEAVGTIAASLAMAAVFETRSGKPWAAVWKTLDGFVSIDRTALEDADLAVGAHIQAAFAREGAIVLALQAPSTAADLIAVYNAEIDQGWPG